MIFNNLFVLGWFTYYELSSSYYVVVNTFLREIGFLFSCCLFLFGDEKSLVVKTPSTISCFIDY